MSPSRQVGRQVPPINLRDQIYWPHEFAPADKTFVQDFPCAQHFVAAHVLRAEHHALLQPVVSRPDPADRLLPVLLADLSKKSESTQIDAEDRDS